MKKGKPKLAFSFAERKGFANANPIFLISLILFRFDFGYYLVLLSF